MKCPQCGQETNDVVCSCGYRFPTARANPAPQKKFCSNCGAEVTGKFCAKCGKPVLQQPTTYSPPQNTARYTSQPSDSKNSEADPSKNGTAVAGFVLSLISFLFSMFILPIITAIIGLILSIIGHKSEKKKLATAGIVLGVLAIVMVFGFTNTENESDAPDGSTRSVSSSSVASKASSKSASKVSSSRYASQPLEVKEPNNSYLDISFYIPETWGYKEIEEVPYYYYDIVHLLYIKTVESNGLDIPLSTVKNEAVKGFETNENAKKVRDLDTSKYNIEMAGFEGELVAGGEKYCTYTYLISSNNYYYMFQFGGTTEDENFLAEKDLILNSIVVSDKVIPASKSSSAANPTKPSDNSIGGVGSTIEYDGLKFTLDSVTEYIDTSEYATDKPDAGNIFIMLNFTVSNDSGEDKHINMFYEDSYCDDVSIDPHPILFNAPGDTIWGDIASGKKRKGYVVYQVPSNWDTLEFQYQVVSIFSSSEKAVFKVSSSDVT